MHERLRLELLRITNRGTLSASLLARQTGLGQAHLSNFLHNYRQLSLQALDRVMSAQHMMADDLLEIVRYSSDAGLENEGDEVPILSFSAALFDPYIRPAVVHSMLHLPDGFLKTLRARPSRTRRAWRRFVALRVSENEALPMAPLIRAHAIARSSIATTIPSNRIIPTDRSFAMSARDLTCGFATWTSFQNGWFCGHTAGSSLWD